MRIFVDMDGTLAQWNNVEFEELFEEGYYRNLEPNRKMLNEVNNLIKQGKDVYILSAYLPESDYAKKEKQEWVKQYLPELSEENQIFVPYGTNKAEYLKENYSPITSQDYLIDDYTKNLLEWKESGGIGVKYLNGINHTKGTWDGVFINDYVGDNISFDKVIKKRDMLSPYYKQYYPTISECKDFKILCNELQSDILDDIEYTVFLWDKTECVEVDNETTELHFNVDENSKKRCNSVFVSWYEGAITTNDLLEEIKNISLSKECENFILTHPILKEQNIKSYDEFQNILSAYNTVEKIKSIIDDAMYKEDGIKTYEDFENLFKEIAKKYPELEINSIEMIEYFDNYMVDIDTKDGVVTFSSNLVNGYEIGTFEIMDNCGTVCTLNYHDLCDVACMYLASVGEEKILCEDINAYHYSFKDNFEDAVKRVSKDCNYDFAVDNKKATVYGNYSIYTIELLNNNDISCSIAGTYDNCPSKCLIYLQHLTNAEIDIINKLDNMYGSEIQNDSLYEKITHNNNYLYEINKYIKENAYTYLDDILSNIKQLPDDYYPNNTNELFSAGLYNCDKLYCDAIEKVMEINLDEFNNTKNEPDICDD